MHNYQLHKSKELIRLVEALKNSAMKFKSGSIVLGQADDTLEGAVRELLCQYAH